jgi:hypothetical protein
LIRNTRNFARPLGIDAIGKHIQTFLHLVQCSGGRTPKARALGPTLALASGASVDDILAQGSWASRQVFDSFYRLSRATQANFTSSVLGTTLQPQPEAPNSEV